MVVGVGVGFYAVGGKGSIILDGIRLGGRGSQENTILKGTSKMYGHQEKKNVLEIVGLNEFGHNHIKPLQDLKDYINRKQIFFCGFTCVLRILSVLKLI